MRLIDVDSAKKKAKDLGGLDNWSTRSVLLLLDSMPTVSVQPNDLLNLEEIQGMDGEPEEGKTCL